jgi:hypothetical protein
MNIPINYGPRVKLHTSKLALINLSLVSTTFKTLRPAGFSYGCFKTLTTLSDISGSKYPAITKLSRHQHIVTGNREAAAIILKIIYGYTIEPHERDPLVDLVDRAMDEFTAAMVPGVWLVDSLPFR